MRVAAMCKTAVRTAGAGSTVPASRCADQIDEVAPVSAVRAVQLLGPALVSFRQRVRTLPR
jgi:hypothetical protein